MGIVDKGDTITFTIDASATFSDTDSRAVFADGDEKNITKYCLLVYDGTSNSSKLLECFDITSLPTTLTLPSPGAGNYRAIMIANSQLSELGTNATTKGTSTIGDLNNATFPVRSHYNIPGGGSDPDGYAPAGAAINFTWSGYVDYTGSTRSMFFNLRPNMAKLTVTVVNKTKSNTAPKDKIKIVNLQIKNVRNRVLHAQNALSDMGYGYFVEQSEGNMGVLDYNIEKLELAPDESKTRHYYIPHNMVDAGGKVRPNAPTKATYIEVDGIRNFDFMDIAYKVYLGSAKNGNPTGDYHVQCDHKYTVNITITNDGLDYNISSSVNQASSGKSTEPEKIVLPPQNNCYMIHPKSSNKSGYILYQMPIFERINEFWGHKTWYTGEANEITDDTEWVAEVIWQDIPTQVMGFSDASGTNTLTTTYSGKGKTPVYFKLKRLDQYGNIVVGVKKKGETAYLWSWHLWVTDYCPDIAPTPSVAASSQNNNGSINGLYIENDNPSPFASKYTIDGQGYYYYESTQGSYMSPVYTNYVYYGNVQHYRHNNTKFWPAGGPSSKVWDAGGIYAEKWIMDRNLGAMAPSGTDLSEPIKGFGLYYQFGRKDPFAYQDTYTISGSKRTNKWTPGSGGTYSNGVRNPNVFYYNPNNGPWLSDGTTYSWYSLTNVNVMTGKKTIFDPCPPGWCVPLSDAFYFATYSPQPTAAWGTGSVTYDTEAASSTVYLDINPNTGYPNDILRNMALITSISTYGSGTRKHLDAAYPMQGYIDGRTYQWVGIGEYISGYPESTRNTIRGCYWTAEKSSNVNYGRLFQFKPRHSESGIVVTKYERNKRWVHRTNSHAGIEEFFTSRGQNIRCIQEPD